MEPDDDESLYSMKRLVSELAPKRRPKKIVIPRRAPSVDVPPPRVIVMTAGIKRKPIKLKQCQVSPLTLYELCAAIVDNIDYPNPFEWSVEQVADWMDIEVGLQRYRACIIDNHIDGKRLLRLEDPSVLPEINIHDFEDIKEITYKIRTLFVTDYIKFARSHGLPIRLPWTHCTWFKSRTGPAWGVRQNWSRSDILRWMKILNPKPLYLDHWDLVWYQKPDFPKVLLARIPKRVIDHDIPRYIQTKEYCNEYLTPRRFRLQTNIPEEAQMIWMEHRPGSPSRRESKTGEVKGEVKVKKTKESRLLPKKVNLAGLHGKDLILARRKMPKPKFLKK